MKSILLFAIVTVIGGILSRLSVCASTDALKSNTCIEIMVPLFETDEFP